MVALYAVWYNFARQHKSLRVSLAMAAGIADRLWSVADIAAKIDAAAPKSGPRGPYNWITLRNPPSSCGRGVGVTASSPADAEALVRIMLGDCNVEQIKPVADMRELDADHVLPNIGNHLRRGVWFPNFPSSN